MLKAVLAPEPHQYRHLRETLIGESFDAITCVAMTGDGRRIIAGTLSGELRSWRASDHALMIALKAHTGEVTDLALSMDERTVASAGVDRMVRLWNAKDGRSLEGHVGGVRRVALSADALSHARQLDSLDQRSVSTHMAFSRNPHLPGSYGSRDGDGAGDNDQPYRFGWRPRASVPYPFSTRQYARLLVFRIHVRDRLADGGDTDGPNWTPAAA
jgi:hypothetical protein